MDKRRPRFGIVGAGGFATVMAHFINECADVVAICDPSIAARRRFVDSTGLKVPEFASFEEMRDKVEFDAVALMGPNFTHPPLAVAAAQAGKHVFCEKMMAITVPECWQMVRACDHANVKLMVGHKRRLREPWAKMIQLRETLGRVTVMSIVGYFDSRPDDFKGWWTRESESGGVLALSGVHELDWMRAMAGDVAAVSAVAGPQIDERYDFPDSVHITIKFLSGAVGFLGVSLSYPLRRYRQVCGAEVTCSEGGMRLVTSLQSAELSWKRLDESNEHNTRLEEKGGNPVGANQALRKEMQDFVRWITEGTEPCLTWREGLRCVELVEAARRSIKQGGTWITLPLYPELEPL